MELGPNKQPPHASAGEDSDTMPDESSASYRGRKARGDKTEQDTVAKAATEEGDGKKPVDDEHPANADSGEPAQRVEGSGDANRIFQRARQLLFSSLTRRIVFLNLSALAVLLSGILYLNQFREGLVEAYKDSLVAQGKIIAGAIASQATMEIGTITVDPDKLLELQAGESTSPTISPLDDLASPVNPEVVAPLLRSLVQPARTRARVYDQDGILVLDTKFLYAGGKVLRYNLPALQEDEPEGMISRIGNFLNRLLQRRDLPTYVEHPNTGIHYPEVVSALTGSPSTVVRMTQRGEQVISVAVPIQRLRVISGVLLLSSEGNEIDKIVTEERLAILRIFLVAAIVLIVLSVLLAGTIATPLRKLSEAANRVRKGVESREEIPDFSNRQDEIGTLSASIRSMTAALYSRIDAIERFAADVSHELKNPLTSLRSAVETLPLAKTDEAKTRLYGVIQHDVKRLDRLITDISDASRLDAELAREQADTVDFAALVANIVSMARDTPSKEADSAMPEIHLDIRTPSGQPNGKPKPFVVKGHEDRLAQVIINIIDNAKSFAPSDGGRIEVTLERDRDQLVLRIADNGPGISAEKVDRIFERFYTDRPESQGFGQNSGLGLSISRQIVEAHGGTIRAENRSGNERGALFILQLPLLQQRRIRAGEAASRP
ncbi:sensor histidine kinase [Salaquimonas pukyongi]|uniref:sensor histidine kinase n=1 Tax=Salaquimonas pukyongi TaxID=2712698 RepID=UPI001FCD585E|nr:sensor histidine kinase [Salaquimonas pukyongi]